jgi:branched-chain amino acid transport system permease protein
MYYFSLIVAFLMIIIASNIVRSNIGRAFVAIKDSEVVGQTLGINLVKYKSIAFGLSAFYAGVAGGLLSAVLRFVSPEGFDFFQIVVQFAMVVIGGLGSIFGSVIGAAFVIVLLESTKSLESLHEIIFGALILIFVIFMPEGIYSIFKRGQTAFREYLSRGARTLL